MIRVVLDTNVVVSAYLSPDGPPSRIVRLALAGLIRCCVCEEIVAEYRKVLARFQANPRATVLFLKKISQASAMTKIGGAARVAAERDDDVFLACAKAAKASYLLTGNLRHFPRTYRYSMILGPADFLLRWQAEQRPTV